MQGAPEVALERYMHARIDSYNTLHPNLARGAPNKQRESLVSIYNLHGLGKPSRPPA